MKRTENVVKTTILNISENIKSCKVSSLPDAEIIKQSKGEFQESMIL
jgi:hypothetical protein